MQTILINSTPESDPFNEDAAEKEKQSISKVIRPTKGITQLPPLLTQPKKVLLIVPPGTMEEHIGRLSGAGGELPLLGLAFIAASLRDQGHQIKIIDFEVHGWPMSRVSQEIQKFQPDVIGMTAYISNMKRCAAVAKIAKQVDPNITVILGGPQVTIFPDEAFNAPEIDIIVLSEGEIIVRNVMNALNDEGLLSKVKGIHFRRKDGTVQKNNRDILIDNLDLFPSPALDLYDLDKYYPPVYIRGKKVAHLLGSRGCPFLCTFCETKLTFGRSFRYHSTERVLSDLERLINQGYKSFQFYDDVFTVNKKRAAELCYGIIEKGWKIQWMCYTRTNTVDQDILNLMRRAGCYMISYGLESANNSLLKLIKKGITVETHIESIRMTKKAGIQVTATFMLGLPTETPEQTENTIRFALENAIDSAIFGITEPYPGTELWVDAQKYGYFDTTGKYSNNLLSEHAAVWIPNNRTRDELKDWVDVAMRRFYLRPRTIFRVIQNFRHLPLHRSFRFMWAGVVFFILGKIRSNSPAQRGTRT